MLCKQPSKTGNRWTGLNNQFCGTNSMTVPSLQDAQSHVDTCIKKNSNKKVLQYDAKREHYPTTILTTSRLKHCELPEHGNILVFITDFQIQMQINKNC